MPKMNVEQTVTTYYSDGSAKEVIKTWKEKVSKDEAFNTEDETITLYGDVSPEEAEEIMLDGEIALAEQEYLESLAS